MGDGAEGGGEVTERHEPVTRLGPRAYASILVRAQPVSFAVQFAPSVMLG